MKYRLYVDEYRNSSLKAVEGESRYLSLTGIAFDLDYVKATVHPELEALKTSYFPHHPDEPTLFHRKELLQRNYPFSSLRNPATRTKFYGELFALLDRWEYTVFTAVIDKSEHLQRYGG